MQEENWDTECLEDKDVTLLTSILLLFEENPELSDLTRSEEGKPISLADLLLGVLRAKAPLLQKFSPTHSSPIAKDHTKLRELFESNFIRQEEFISKQRPLLQNALTLIPSPSSASVADFVLPETPTPAAVTLDSAKEEEKKKEAEDTKEEIKKEQETEPPAEKEKESPPVLCLECPSVFPEHWVAECPFVGEKELFMSKPTQFKVTKDRTIDASILKEINEITPSTNRFSGMHCKGEQFTYREAKLFWQAVEKHKPPLTNFAAAYGKAGSKSGKWLGKMLKQCKMIDCFDLQQNPTLGDKGVTFLAEGLKDHPHLTDLNLASVSMGDQGAKALSTSLSTRLVKLELQTNTIAAQGSKWLARYLLGATKLTRLDLNANPGMSEEGIRWLAPAVASLPSLTYLSLAGCSIGDEGVKVFAQHLPTMTALRDLSIGSNGISNDGVAVLAKALEQHPLTSFKMFSSLKVNEEGFVHLANFLRLNNSLQKFDVEVGGVDVESLSKAVVENNRLTTLGLTNHSATDETFEGYCKGLKLNKGISTLVFWGGASKLTDKTAHSLGAMLKENSSITSMTLVQSRIGAAGLRSIAESLRVNKTLEYLDIRGHPEPPLTDEDMQPWVKVLEEANTTFQQLLVRGETLTLQALGRLTRGSTDVYRVPGNYKFY